MEQNGRPDVKMSNGHYIDAVDESETKVEVVWNAARFVDLYKQLRAARTEDRAVRILHELAAIEQDVDAIDWLEAKNLISLALSTVTAEKLVTTYHELLEFAVRKCSSLVVDVVAAFIHDAKLPKDSPNAASIGAAFASRISDAECTGRVASVLTSFIEKKEVCEELLSQLHATHDPEVRGRIYEVCKHKKFTKIQAVRVACYEGIVPDEFTVFFECLSADLKTNDMLEQLAVIEVLAEFADCGEKTLKLMQDQKIDEEVYNLFVRSRDSPEGGFLHTSKFPPNTLYSVCLRFFGHFCAGRAGLLHKYPYFLDSTLDQVRHFDSLDASGRVLAFDTLSYVASTPQSRRDFIDIKGEAVAKIAMTNFGVAIRTSMMEMRTRLLQALATLLGEGKIADPEEQIAQWFAWLGDAFPRLILELLLQPFSSQRLAIMEMLYALFAFKFGRNLMRNTEEFMDWLCNADTEVDHFAIESKKNIVRQLMDTAEADGLPFAPEVIVHFEDRVIHRHEPEPQVGFENL